jgi:hypothetical protein
LKLRNPAQFIISIMLLSAACAATSGTKTEWVYQSYNVVTEAMDAPGYITLEESESGSTLKIFVPSLVKCFQQKHDATVERTDKTITITTTPPIFGCDQNRFILKADGTGGKRQTKVNDKWITDKRERVLTLKN